MKKKDAEPKAATSPIVKTYEMRNISLTERQIIEYDIQDNKVVATKEHDPDLGHIVVGKLIMLLQNQGK